MEIAAEDVLRTYGNPSLQQMVRQRELPGKPKTKEQYIAALAPVADSDRPVDQT